MERNDQDAAEPWIGNAYAHTGLLLLGESAYSWEEEGVVRHPSPYHATELVEWVKAGFSDANRFMRLLSRALSGTYEPSPEQLSTAWDRVAFTNYVPGTVGFGPRLRPSGKMWEAAERRFLNDLLPSLQPRRIIVLGRTMWGRMPERSSVINEDVQSYRNLDGTAAICWAVSHPSRGLSWSSLAAIVQFACNRELSAK